MNSKFPHIPKADRKNILLLADDITMHSGIATMARQIVIGTAHHFNWYNLGAANNHPNLGKMFDLSPQVNAKVGIDDASVLMQPNNGYGNIIQVRGLIKKLNPDAIMIFTDPRYWTWLFEMEREIRSQGIPIIYYNIWDAYPAPMYNKDYYASCDALLGISKQTVNINKLVLGDLAEDKIIKYVPHGINPSEFFPIEADNPVLNEFKDKLFGEGVRYEYSVLFNSRNMRRKQPSDVILSWRKFTDKIGVEAAKKCVLVMHTDISNPHGTDLGAVADYFKTEGLNVIFSTSKLSTPQMNMLYNCVDATMLISSNEGWGLSLTESMMAGKMIIANTTGGMQDQMKFVDDSGDWIDFDDVFLSNNIGKYRRAGKWAVPVFPACLSVQGSPQTPYIFDERCSTDDVCNALSYIWTMKPEERAANGMLGREWVLSEESGMTAQAMSDGIIEGIEQTFAKFKPRPKYETFKIGELEPYRIPHKI